MKKAVLIVFILLIINLLIVVSAINLDIEKQPITETIIREIMEPAVFNFTIKNLGATDNFEIYSLVGVDFSPKGTFNIGSGETKNLEVKVYPKKRIRKDSGFATFVYKIRGVNSGEIQDDKLTIRLVEIEDAIDIYTDKIHPDNTLTTLYIENKENYEFPSLTLKISSILFSLDTALNLEPLETKEFKVELDVEELKTLIAGQYPMNIEFINFEKKMETSFEILEKKYISVRQIKSGLFIREKHIVKTNEGSLPVEAEIKEKKNILSRLFTNFNIIPTQIERRGLSVYYTWKKQINPGEKLDLIIKTNYLFPFLLIFGIVLIIWLLKVYNRKHVELGKKVSFVKTKSGIFALKINLKIKANQYIEKVSVIDKLPVMVKLHERFSSLSPDKIDSLNRRLIWNFSNLAEGEERVMSYIIYSKIGILGKFELPSAVCIYEIEDKVHEQESNKSFFVAEQKTGADD